MTTVLFGAAAGASLRGRAAEADAPLPLDPRARALGALAGAACAAVLSAFFVWGLAQGAGACLGADTDLLLKQCGFATLAPQAYLLPAAFALAYVTAHAVIGGALAVFLGAATWVPLGFGFYLADKSGSIADFLVPASVSAALALASVLAFLVSTARAERRARRSVLRVTMPAVLLLSGAAAPWEAYAYFHGVLWRQGEILDVGSSGAPTGRAFLPPATLRAGDHGVLVADLDGGLRLVGHDGRRSVLIPGSTPFFGLEPGPRVQAARRDAAGDLWALRAPSGYHNQRTEVWHGRGDAPLSLFAVVNGDLHFADHGWELGVLAPGGRYAPLSAARPGLRWTRAMTAEQILAFLDQGWEDGRHAAHLGSRPGEVTGDLGGGERRWKFDWPVDAPPDETGAYPARLKTVQLGGRPAVIVWHMNSIWYRQFLELLAGGRAWALRADGRREALWRSAAPPRPMHSAVDGTLWTSGSDALLVALPDGRPLRPLPRIHDVTEGYYYESPCVVHATARAVWLAKDDGTVYTISAVDGRRLRKVGLPTRRDGGTYQLQETSLGVFFYDAGRRLYFVDWDLNIKDLGPV